MSNQYDDEGPSWGYYYEHQGIVDKMISDLIRPRRKVKPDDEHLDPIWVTREWRVIVIKNLEDGHLVNIVNCLNRFGKVTNRFGQVVMPYLLIEIAKRRLGKEIL